MSNVDKVKSEKTMRKVTFKISNELVPHLIGKAGWRIEEMMRLTNTRITIGKDKDDDGKVECCITSMESENLELAKYHVRKFVQDHALRQKQPSNRDAGSSSKHTKVYPKTKDGESVSKKSQSTETDAWTCDRCFKQFSKPKLLANHRERVCGNEAS